MNTRSTERRGWRRNSRSVTAVASCVLGIGMMLVGLSTGSGSKGTPAAEEKQESAKSQNRKKLPAWNMALGNLVVIAKELGFSVRVAKGLVSDEGKVASRIEGQLRNMRELYRQESENNKSLMGALVLQLTVSADGDVTSVKEIASRITDNEFKKAVVAEVSQWTFGELMAEAATIYCPLLFVREGMDITTLVNWEKSLGQLDETSILSKSNIKQNINPQPIKPTENKIRAAATVSDNGPSTAAKLASRAGLYQIKYETTIRKGPNFTSPDVAKVAPGTKVMVVGRQGDWIEVRHAEGGPSGYLRKEFLAPVAIAKN